MRKLFGAVLCALCLARFAFGQAASVRPDDTFYADVAQWEQRGLLEQAPNLRPYPLHIVRGILETVMEAGNERDVEIAREHYERIFSKPLTVSLEGGGALAVRRRSGGDGRDTETARHGFVAAAASGSMQLTPLVSYAYDAGIFARRNQELLPLHVNSSRNAIFDSVEMGPLDAYVDANMAAAVGSDSIYASAGLGRSGYGPFLNGGFALNDSAFHSVNVAFAFIRPRWNYVHQLSSLGATDMTGSVDSLSYNKFFALHAVELRPLRGLSVSYYESVVFGHRFEFAYALPLMFMAAQNLSGANDNLQMGILVEWMPFDRLMWTTDMFFDDYDLDELFKGNFDAKNRFGFRTGLSYTPESSVLARIGLDYTVQTPYLYAHWDYEGDRDRTYTARTMNYQNYTNAGLPFGSSLPPNSDRIALSATFRPARGLSLTLSGAFMRHANVCEDYSDDEAYYYIAEGKSLRTDGSLYSSQMYGGGDTHIASAWDRLSLLSQDDTRYTVQAGLQAEYALPVRTKAGVSLKFGYMFEYIRNAGIDRDIWAYNARYSAESPPEPSAADKAAAVEAARRAWQDALYDEMNHYISLSLKVAY